MVSCSDGNDSLGRRCGYFDQWYWTGA